MKTYLSANKKEHGDSTYVATMISIFFIVLLFVALFFNYAQIATQNKVERAYRKYLLKMETTGYLTDTDQAALASELTNLGVKNVDLSLSSLSPVGYGNEIVLRIIGDLEVDKLSFSATGNASKVKEAVHIDIKKTGTALY